MHKHVFDFIESKSNTRKSKIISWQKQYKTLQNRYALLRLHNFKCFNTTEAQF